MKMGTIVSGFRAQRENNAVAPVFVSCIAMLALGLQPLSIRELRAPEPLCVRSYKSDFVFALCIACRFFCNISVSSYLLRLSMARE